jgi:quinol monooxygenase YgiN
LYSPLSPLIIGRYKDRDALYNIHFKSQAYRDIRRLRLLARFIDNRVLATPDLLDGEIKLVNALPVAGFLTRSDEDRRDYKNDYIRCAKLRVNAGSTDHIVSKLKAGISSISSVPEIRSFLVFQPLDEVDIIFIWERYASLSALAEIENGSNYSKVMEEIKPLLAKEEMTAYRVAGGYLSK